MTAQAPGAAGCASNTNGTSALTKANDGTSGIVLANGNFEYELPASLTTIPTATAFGNGSQELTIPGAVKMTNESDKRLPG